MNPINSMKLINPVKPIKLNETNKIFEAFQFLLKMFLPTLLYTGSPTKVRTGGLNPILGSLSVIANRLIMVDRTFYHPSS